MMIKRALVALAATLTITTTAANAVFLLPDPNNSRPVTGASVPREQGRKGILLKMQCLNDDGTTPSAACWPLHTSPPLTLIINHAVATPITCTEGLSSSGACRYVFGAFTPGDPNVDTFKIFYDGYFAPGPVALEVRGAIGTSSTELCPTPGHIEPRCTLSYNVKNNPPRPLASLELVFDISGSMGLPAAPPPAVCGSTTRMVALKTAAQSVFTTLNSYAMLGDKVGAVYFSNNATVFDPTPVTSTNLEPAHDPTQVGLISGDLQGRSPKTSTSIGSGLLAAKVSGFDADPNSNPTKRVFLFSDGEQNTVPCVGQPNASPCNSTQSMTPIQVGGSNYPNEIKICPVTVGQLSGPGNVLQQTLGNLSCDGKNVHAILHDPMNPTSCQSATNDLQTFFTQTLANILMGDKLEHVRDVTGQVAAGADTTEKFLANANDGALSVLLSWEAKEANGELAERFLPFRLKAPDGTLVDPRFHTQYGIGMSFTTVRFPLRQNGAEISPKGEWEVQLLGTSLHQSVGYHLIIMLDNPNIASGYSIDIRDAGTGEPIPVRVKLTENGAPVVGANIVAQVIGPENGVGNILSNAPTPPGIPNTGGDTLRSEAQRKLLLLLQDPASATLFKDKSLPSLVLLDNGDPANGDTAGNDGIYSGLFTGALQEGHYRFVVNVRGKSATDGDFMRTQLDMQYVRAKAVSSNTALTVQSSAVQPNGNVIIVLRATAKDRFGNFVGPDYIGHLNIVSSEGTIETQLADKLDGSYEIGYRLPSDSADPVISVVVMGDEVKSSPLSELPGSSVHPSKIYLWLIIIIIAILVLVILALLIYRRRHP